MTTLVEAWKAAQQRLKAARIDSPAIDARFLLEAAANVTRLEILSDPYRELAPEVLERLDDYLSRRERREPVSRILGRKGFWKLLFTVTPHVLSPRPETETLLDVVLPQIGEHEALTILDLGVGSGAILLSILAERPATRGLGVDISDEALATARDNAANLDLAGRAAFFRTDWTDALAPGSFDIVVSNPPYIRSGDIPDLDPEVKDHDPVLALDGGPDGLDAYRTLAPRIVEVLKPGGLFAVEVGADQAAEVATLFGGYPYENIKVQKDLSDRERVVWGRKRRL